MTLIASIDGTVSPRLVHLHADTVGASLHPIDIYKEMRALRASDESLRKFDLFMKASGNDPKGSGKFTERFVTLLNTRIVPYNTTHNITIIGTIITDDGLEGIFAFDKLPLSPTSNVDISYVPPQVEVITVSTGAGSLHTVADIWSYAARELTGGEYNANITTINGVAVTDINDFKGLDANHATMLLEIYRLYGLDPTKPLIVDSSQRSAGVAIVQSITDNNGEVTVTRTV
jgi:hypothetical protein